MISKLSFILIYSLSILFTSFPMGPPSSPLSALLTPQPSPVGPEFFLPAFPRPRGEIGVLLNPDCHLYKYCLAYHIQLHLIRFYQSLLSSPDPRPYFVCSFSRSWFTITLSNTVLTLGDLVYMSMTLPIPKPFNLLNFCPAVIFPSPHT